MNQLVMEMWLLHTSLLIVLCFINVTQSRSSSQYGPFSSAPEQEWNKLAKALEEENALAHGLRSKSNSGSSVDQPRRLPTYVTVSADMVQKYLFKPEKGFRALPHSVVDILYATPASLPENPKNNVEVLCHIDRMYVKVKKELFNNRNAYKLLKLGTCPVNKSDKDYYYFLYLLKTDCGFKTESTPDTMNIDITLHYKPPQSTTRWIRLSEMPFTISLQCQYHRWFHSYAIGFHPKLMGGTVFKRLSQKNSFVLISQDASGNKLTGSKVYTLGQTMYLEARRADSTSISDEMRLYINKCYVTTSQDPNSSPKAMVIDQQGCMIDGKLTRRSRFLTCPSKKIQRFSLGTFLFEDTVSGTKSQQLFIHCHISLGKLEPTQTSKACNYDLNTGMWKELYGDDTLCACCEHSTCVSKTRASKDIDTSLYTWKVEFDDGNMGPLDTEISHGQATIGEDYIDSENNWEDDY